MAKVKDEEVGGFGMDFADEVHVVDVPMELGWGDFGVQLKQVLEASGATTTFVFGMGKTAAEYVSGQMDEGYDINNKALMKLYTSELWLNTADLTPEAATAQGYKDKHFPFTTHFFDSQKHLGGEWYKDLCYPYDKADEKKSLADGVFTVESFSAQRGGGSWFDGKAVITQLWYFIPVIQVEITGKGANRVITPVKTMLLKLKGSARGQSGLFFKAISKFADRDDPSVYLGLIDAEREDNFYNFAASAITIPEDERELYDSQFDLLNARVKDVFSTAFKVRHGGHPMSASNPKSYAASNDAVRGYITSITQYNTWDEYVADNSIAATPFDESGLVEVSAFDTDDVPF